ncbi:hypothetical protein SNE40_007649 [Patella caerulea]|uniref:Ependymin n=1 Tax=Patella caerulea TaxID=87958 RepID=A0AAN8JY41_PATCE
MLRLALLSACALYVLSNAPSVNCGCCTPEQWEGTEGLLGGYYRWFRPSLISSGSRVAYDGMGKRVAAVSSVQTKRGRFLVRVIENFSEGTLYMINLSRKKCRKLPLEREFRKACIPDRAKLMSESYIGAGDNTLGISGYALRIDNKKKRALLDAFVTVTTEGCIPVSETLTGSVRGVSFLDIIGYVNVTAGIEDEKVFDPPSYCDDEPTDDFEIQESQLYREFRIFGM